MKLSSTFEIETDQLTLYVPDDSNAQDMVEFLENNRDQFKLCSPNYHDITQASFWEKRFSSATANFHNKAGLSLLIKHKDNHKPIIGDINFDGVMRGVFQACFLGFRLDKYYVGKGLMFEALSKAIDIIFNDWQLHRIMANYRPDNSRSGNLLERLNFKQEGFAENYLFIDGEWRDHVLTALTNQNYNFP